MTSSIDGKTAKRWPRDPYRGLTYYTAGDVPLFAGRESDIDAVCGSIGLGNIRILLLHGLTGCGKSSFLRAGLIPALEDEIAGYEFLRDEKGRPDFVRSTDDPTASLARAIHRFIKREYSSAPESRRTDARDVNGSSNSLRYEPKEGSATARTSLVLDVHVDEAEFVRAVAVDTQKLVRTVEQIASQRPRTFVLVIDQVEEVVTLKPDSMGDPARIQFFDFLADLSRSRYDLKMIICFRTEYHGQFYAQLRYGADVSRINDYYLNDFTEEQLLEAILRPTSREQVPGYGVPYDHYRFDYEADLPGEIAKALLARGLSGGVLPALQIVCRRWYEAAKLKSSTGTDEEDGEITVPVRSNAEYGLVDVEFNPKITPFTIKKTSYTTLGRVAGQVISYVQSELEAALKEPFAERVRASGRRNEIDGWRRVLTSLVKTQINGTVTTNVIPEEALRKEAARKGCKIEPKDMLLFLSDEGRRILRFVDVTKHTTKEVIRCCSLGHDILASALQEWSERARPESYNSIGGTVRDTRTASNVNGKAYAMNVMTPMEPWKSPILRGLFSVLSAVKPLQKDLKGLSSNHFAQWVIVGRDRFPHLSPRQPREDLRYDYLFFFSNFNGTWNQYLDGFSAVLSRGLDLIWRWSEKYPGSVPVIPFKGYINQVQFDTDYYYNAYPKATINDVKAALRVHDALESFSKSSQTLSSAEFEKAYLRFLIGVLPDLGSTGMAPEET